MKGRYAQIPLFLFLILILNHCAQMTPLTGGERDTIPPKLLESSPANNSLNFSSKLIIFTFDEYVQVRDLTNQVMVSPKVENTPSVKAEGKKVLVNFEDQKLRPNTTYRIAFGKAICDMNESNPTESLEFVFSTGNHIDSLKVSGLITDAITNAPLGGVIAGLYEHKISNDSTPYIYIPNYIAKTTDDGRFSFKYLPNRTYDVFAFSDKNKNNLYDGETEKIGFLDQALKLSKDTNIHFKLFQEEASKTFVKNTFTPFYGLIQILLNKKARVKIIPVSATDGSNFFETRLDQEKDTIQLFYRNLSDSITLALHYVNLKRTDTLNITIPDPNKSKKRPAALKMNTQGGILGMGQKLALTFISWMDTSRTFPGKLSIINARDSTRAPLPVAGLWKDLITFEINTPFTEGQEYILRLDTGAFYSIRGNSNDTLRATFITKSKLEFGKVTLNITLNKKQDYLIQLIDEQSAVVREKAISLSLSSSNSVSVDFTEVPPGTYRVKIVFDDNKNQKWDSGNLLLRKQPERVIINSKQLKIIADWDMEEEIIEKDQN